MNVLNNQTSFKKSRVYMINFIDILSTFLIERYLKIGFWSIFWHKSLTKAVIEINFKIDKLYLCIKSYLLKNYVDIQHWKINPIYKVWAS